jgi:probable F420-dependent oxidoreductase
VRFHQAVAFLETDQLLELCAAIDDLPYSGIYVSEHMFYPRDLQSRYPYSPYEDGSPIWSPESDWPDPWCLISALAAVTRNQVFTTGVYVAPARDLITVAKLVGTAAAISQGRVRLGVGAGWCKEEFDATGQDFASRGKRLDDMIPALRALWQPGWVEYHGPHYDVPPLQMNPVPPPIPIYGGGASKPALRRAATLCDGWLCSSQYTDEQAWHYLDLIKAERAKAGRDLDGFAIYMATVNNDLDFLRRLEDAGVTDYITAPWMVAVRHEGGSLRSNVKTKVEACERFAEDVIAKLNR